MDTGTAIPTVATTLPLTMAVATMDLVTTGVDITATVTMAAVLMVLFMPATLTGQALAPNRVWCDCSSDSPEPVTIEGLSMESWDLAPVTPSVPTSMTMAQASTE